MNGKIIILAGGISSRMNNSRHDAGIKAKSMIKIGSMKRPFLDYLLMNICEAGYDEVLIVVGERDDSIREYYSSKNNKPLSITFAVQMIPPGRNKPMGTADALLTALKTKPAWNSHSFTVCNSDNLYSANALNIIKNLPHPNAMIDYDRDSLGFGEDRTGKFAVTEKDAEGFLTGIIEKPGEKEIESVKSDNGFVGVSMNLFRFSCNMIFPFLELVPFNPLRGEKELPSAVNMMVSEFPKSLFAFPLKEKIPDLTSGSDIALVANYIEEKFRESSI